MTIRSFRQGLRKVLEERPAWEVIAEGDGREAVASLLHVSPSTVETHRAHIKAGA